MPRASLPAFLYEHAACQRSAGAARGTSLARLWREEALLMDVARVMTHVVHTCRPEDDLAAAAKQMWEGDFGSLPVLDDGGRLIGMITDRDVCMAAYTRGAPLEDGVEQAALAMSRSEVRRLPVVDDANQLVGLISLADVAQHAASVPPARRRGEFAEVGATLSSVTRPRSPQGPRSDGRAD
jgi:CBS-domain-containing membrane protein